MEVPLASTVLPVWRFSRKIGLFLVALREIFCCCWLHFFGQVLSKRMRFFGLFLRKIFLSKIIVFVNFAEVVRFVLT